MASIVGSNIHVLSNSQALSHNPSVSTSYWAAQSNIQSLIKIQLDKDKQKTDKEDKKIPDVNKSERLHGDHIDDKLEYNSSKRLNDKQEYEYDETNHLVHINIVI